MNKTERINIEDIRIDGGTQPRTEIDEATVDEYTEALHNEAVFPPIEVTFDGKDYWLWDGFHRLLANRRAGAVTIDANVQPGGRRDAVLLSVGANATHGLRRSNADKRAAVLTLLRDAEWCGWSDREIARRCGVSPDTVGRIRRELAPSLSDSDSDDTDNHHQNEQQRSFTTKHGATATMNTANIGRKAQPAPDPDLDDWQPNANCDDIGADHAQPDGDETVACHITADDLGIDWNEQPEPVEPPQAMPQRPDGGVLRSGPLIPHDSEPDTQAMDYAGQVIPRHLLPVFGGPESPARLIAAAQAVVQDLRRRIRAMDTNPYLHLQKAETDLKNVWENLKFGKPYAVCPLCHGKGCGGCRQVGWMSKEVYQNVPEDQR